MPWLTEAIFAQANCGFGRGAILEHSSRYGSRWECSAASGAFVPGTSQLMSYSKAKLRRLDVRLLWFVCIVTGAFRIFTMIRWGNNFLWPDEVYQSLEQAHRLVFGYGIIPWEFRDAVRSWVFPGALAIPMALGAPFGHGLYLVTPRVALSILSLAPVAATYLWARRGMGRDCAAIAALCVGAWFELAYFAPKALAEVAATHVLMLGLYLLLEHRGTNSKLRAYFAGALLTTAALLRLQLAPGIAAAYLTQIIADWKTRQPHWNRGKSMLVGAIPVIALFALVDAITWRYPFRSIWNYFAINILSGKAAKYGVLPFDAFWEYFANVWSMMLVPVVLFAVRGTRGRWPLMVAALVTFLVHSLIAHKEYRFDYPVVVIVIVLAALGLGDVLNRVALKFRRLSLRRAVPIIGFLAWSAVSLVLALRFDMALIQVPMELNHNGRPWLVRKGAMSGMQEIGQDPGTCGVGMIYVGWGYVGGYAFLHRKIPMFEIRHRGELAKMSHLVNTLIARGRVRDFSPYKLVKCWEEYCIYRRPGGCQPPDKGYSINDLLISRKQ